MLGNEGEDEDGLLFGPAPAVAGPMGAEDDVDMPDGIDC